MFLTDNFSPFPYPKSDMYLVNKSKALWSKENLPVYLGVKIIFKWVKFKHCLKLLNPPTPTQLTNKKKLCNPLVEENYFKQ